jgi:hypothetical protein
LWQPLPQVDEGKENLGAIKGGEACHIPKFWEYEINKIGTMYVCID